MSPAMLSGYIVPLMGSHGQRAYDSQSTNLRQSTRKGASDDYPVAITLLTDTVP